MQSGVVLCMKPAMEMLQAIQGLINQREIDVAQRSWVRWQHQAHARFWRLVQPEHLFHDEQGITDRAPSLKQALQVQGTSQELQTNAARMGYVLEVLNMLGWKDAHIQGCNANRHTESDNLCCLHLERVKI